MTLTIAPVDGQILKRDTAGRVRTPRERREALLMEFDRSGMSGQKFAAWAGMKYTTFANWLQRRRKQPQSSSGAKGTEAVQWVQDHGGDDDDEKDFGCARAVIQGLAAQSESRNGKDQNLNGEA